MFSRKNARLLIAASVIALLAACDSAEERAEKHYQNSLELFAAGDADRGLVELRNVFELNESHREARALYASELLKLDRPQEAYGHYLRLVEQYPDEVEGRIVLAQIALEGRQWEEVDRHAPRAIEAAPEDPRVEVIAIAVDYRNATEAKNAPDRRDAARRAAELFENAPENPVLAALLIDSYSLDGDNQKALDTIGTALEAQPDTVGLYLLRLGLLERMGEVDALEGYLVELNERFPDQVEYQQMMLRYFVSRGETEKAESFLREIVSPMDEDLRNYTGFIQFLRDNKGVDAALAELDSALGQRPDEITFKALQSTLRFDIGQRDEAIAEMEKILQDAPPSDTSRRFKVALSRMLLATSNEVGARRLVEEVLTEDSSHIDAIKMQAAWMIEEDRSSEAISILRRALDEAPNDAQVMTLMARAHARNGDPDVSRDLLGLAAEASNYAPAESVRYARALVSEQEYATAETILISSLRARPNTLETLVLLAEIYIATEDWSRVAQVEANLRRMETEASVAAADRVRVALLTQQERSGEAIAFLEQQFDESDGDARALGALIQNHLRAGDTESARSILDAALAENPDNDDMRFLDGALEAASGNLDRANEIYRELLAKYPGNERIWMELMRVAGRQGDEETVARLIDEGLAANPAAPNLLWAKATRLEQQLDIDGAIGVYEQLYELSSNSVVAANNLASLLATYRGDDAESIDRAYRIARRLRGSPVPHFQDTYGWIAYLNGRYDEALEHLEPAANALQDDPIVQYHLGMVYLAQDRGDAAAAQFEKALELAGTSDTRAQFDDARERLAELKAAQETQAQ